MSRAQKAAGELKEKLSTGQWIQGTRLPPLSELAEMFGVSRITMWRAIGLLKQESLINTRQGGAIYAGAERPARRPRQPLLWEQVATRLGQDVLAGRFSHSPFSAAGKMAGLYSVDARTFKKALGRLIEEGILKTEGRRFVPAQKRMTNQSTDIVLISYGDSEQGLISWGDPRTQAVVESLERECQKSGYTVRCEGFDFHKATCLLEISTVIKSLTDAAGFIVNLWNPWETVHKRRWLDLLDFLIARKMPVVAIDQAGSFTFPTATLRSNLFRVLRIAGESSGSAVGAVLMRRGHSRIAFITQSFEVDWVQNRYRGIKRYVEEYGSPNGRVELFALNEYSNLIDLQVALLDLKPAEMSGLFRDWLPEEEIRDRSLSLKSPAGQTLSRGFWNNSTVTTMRTLARFLSHLKGKQRDSYIYGFFWERLMHLAGDVAVKQYLSPFFKKILRTGGCTAWVCADEKTARASLSFLKKNRVRVPEEIAIITFENWREEYEKNLSVYDFNMSGMVQQAVLLIVDEKTRKNSQAISEVNGYVVERRTTRK